MRLKPTIQSWPLFFLAIGIESLAVLLLIGCVHAYVVDLPSLTESAETPDPESFNFFSRTIFDSAIRSAESSGSNSPTAVIDSAKSTIFLLGGISIFATVGAMLIFSINTKTPNAETGE